MEWPRDQETGHAFPFKYYPLDAKLSLFMDLMISTILILYEAYKSVLNYALIKDIFNIKWYISVI